MVQYEVKVAGRVQGVGFRYFVLRKATELGIKGWVRNTTEGGVLVMAQGDAKDMETFFDYLQIGPPLARVISLRKNQMPQLEDFSDFRIKH
ncbi:acylphosphatase [Mariniphaga anaerophila]|uniref:Acylphosphatase n=1 Tax=Mariniphaga anaerophila TaxID=1484053 RepID=A0A1M4XZA3_9BACT|nr:acylphosphatase [Mariniphaga anaerophila]SHE98770.1 acylphosphatase [Mariniphaga anaerophila]